MYGTPEALAQLAETNARNAEMRAKTAQLLEVARNTNANGYYANPGVIEIAEAEPDGGPVEAEPEPQGFLPNPAQGRSGTPIPVEPTRLQKAQALHEMHFAQPR